jgi:hypothetical protein
MRLPRRSGAVAKSATVARPKRHLGPIGLADIVAAYDPRETTARPTAGRRQSTSRSSRAMRVPLQMARQSSRAAAESAGAPQIKAAPTRGLTRR